MILFILTNLALSLMVHLYTEWTDIMSNLDKMADGLPLFVSLAIVTYFATYKKELYELTEYMNKNFKWHSSVGLTNMTMQGSYKTAKNFAYFYTACTIFSVAMYVVLPVIGYLWFNHPLQPWIYKDVSGVFIVFVFLRQCIAQAFVALAVGQLGVFFACNSILLCGQLDLLCCSLRNVRYTALIQNNVAYEALNRQVFSISEDEEHNYTYNKSEMKESGYHYDEISMTKFMTKPP
ncbi:unnamed protein product [Leptosia nina]|uniref:Uncharacterized protein n=1 Tax=Leptosia nina TaxID=320188 RepID=A0AAV1IZS4_9NEOP